MRLFLSLGLCLLVTGCGGDLRSPAGALTRAVAFRIEWGALTRQAVLAPSQAQSARLTLQGARADGSDLVFDVGRDPGQSESYTQTYTVSEPVRVGSFTLSAVFFAEPQPGGEPLGTVQSRVDVREEETVIPITTVQPPATIRIAPGQSVAVGQDKLLEFTARDKDNNLIAVGLDQAGYEVLAGANNLEIVRGRMQGRVSGQATVRVRIGDVQSPSETVTVTSNVRVAVAPESAALPVRGMRQFTATVTGASDAGVTWSVQEGAAGGSITPGGLYTAPNEPGTFHIVAASREDPGQRALAMVTVEPGGVAIEPDAATLTLGESRQFTATVMGAQDTAVFWSVQEGTAGGSITPGGLYTAPNEPGTFHIVAVSRADPTRQAVATVTVETGSGVVIVQ